MTLQDKKFRAKIVELQEKKHLPAELVALVSEVTRLQGDSLSKVAFANDREGLGEALAEKISLREKRYAGMPILPGKDFPVDMPLVADLAQTLLRMLPEIVPALAACASELAATLNEPGVLEAACREILESPLTGKKQSRLDAWAKKHPATPHFFRFVLTSAAMPSLTVVGRLLGEEHDKDKVWTHGHCPVCANQPLIGRLVDKEGRRMHTCSFCGFDYRAPRMGCPFCLAPEAEGSEYQVCEEEPGYLLTACKSCNNYFKLGDFREFDRPWFPLLDDLSSLTLDIYAMQLGFSRPTLSGWGF